MKIVNLEDSKIKKIIDAFFSKNEYYKEGDDAYIIDEVTENTIEMRLAVNCELTNIIAYKYNALKNEVYKFSAGKARWQTAEVSDEFQEILKELHKRLQIFLK